MYEPCTQTQANEFDPGDPEREREKEKEIEENRPLGSSSPCARIVVLLNLLLPSLVTISILRNVRRLSNANKIIVTDIIFV